ARDGFGDAATGTGFGSGDVRTSKLQRTAQVGSQCFDQVHRNSSTALKEAQPTPVGKDAQPREQLRASRKTSPAEAGPFTDSEVGHTRGMSGSSSNISMSSSVSSPLSGSDMGTSSMLRSEEHTSELQSRE